MATNKIRSYAKINLALNIIGKSNNLHKIESIISFVNFYDEILIKNIKSENHAILFYGKFSKNISKKNTISKLLNVLEKKKILAKKQRFQIKINKKIPNRAGLGGGSMNAAIVLKYLLNKKIIKISTNKVKKICKLIGSDVILGLNQTNCIITHKNKIKYFKNCSKFYTLIIKPNFGCSTKKVYSGVTKFDKIEFSNPQKKMFNHNYLKNKGNSLEPVVFSKHNQLRKIKLFLEGFSKVCFARMTGSGSAIVAYFKTKEKCENAKKKFKKKYKNYWCITSKTI